MTYDGWRFEQKHRKVAHYYRGGNTTKSGKAICGSKDEQGPPYHSPIADDKCEHCLNKGTHNLLVKVEGNPPQTFRFLNAKQRRGFRQGFEEAMRFAHFEHAWKVVNTK